MGGGWVGGLHTLQFTKAIVKLLLYPGGIKLQLGLGCDLMKNGMVCTKFGFLYSLLHKCRCIYLFISPFIYLIKLNSLCCNKCPSTFACCSYFDKLVLKDISISLCYHFDSACELWTPYLWNVQTSASEGGWQLLCCSSSTSFRRTSR